MASTEADVAARLIERLLADAEFRSRFRRDPAAACREAGLDELADEMALGAGKAMHTLDVRESKSSLAGVMMAAAMEGVGIYAFSEHVLPHLEEIPGHVADVLSRVDLPAIGGGGGGGHGGAALADAAGGGGGAADAAAGAGGGPGAAAADAAAGSGGGAGAAADAAAGPGGGVGAGAPAGSGGGTAAGSGGGAAAGSGGGAAAGSGGGAAAGSGGGAAAGSGGASAAASGDGAGAGAAHAAGGGATPETAAAGGAPPEAAHAATAGRAGTARNDGGEAAADTTLPAGEITPKRAVLLEPDGKRGRMSDASGPAQAAAVRPQAAAPPEAAAQAPAPTGAAADAATAGGGGAGHHLDPHQFGADGVGTGGPPSPETLALLRNRNVVFDSTGISDLKAGRIDPRVVAILTHLSKEHKLVISCMCSDHSRFTSGGSVSNHNFGRGVDIASVDGQIVNAGNPIAREIAGELSGVEDAYRPNEIGSPWAISGPGYFTDAEHQNHLHIGFKQVISPDWTPPPDVAAPGGGAAAGAAAAAPPEAAAASAAAGAQVPGAAAAAGAPGVAAAAGAPAPPAGPRQTLAFVESPGAKAAAARAHARPANTLAFLKAADPKAQAAGQPPEGNAASTAADFGGGPDQYPGDNAPREQIAAWMAEQAKKRGLPPQLPVMASLVESGMRNLSGGDRDSVGFFQMRVGTWNNGPYAGYPDKPELQVKWFLDQAEAIKKQRLARAQSVTDPHQFGEWIADVERPAEQYRGRYQLQLDNANGLLKAHAQAAPAPAQPPEQTPVQPAAGAVADAGAAAPGGGSSPLGAAALHIAQTQKGVHEIGGANIGPQVDKYLAAAGVAPGNPWCASFVTWSLQQAGHKMPGGGWAAVATWVHNAQQGANGLKIVSADEARPGDIVAYDWGGGTDFSSDGHIGFLDSSVRGGQFTALEGNNADAVNVVPRHLGGGPNIVFLRIAGNAPAGAGAPATPDAGLQASAAAASAPAAAAPDPGLQAQRQGTLAFHGVQPAKAAAGERRATLGFIKAAQPGQAQTAAPGAPPEAAAAAGATPSGDGAATAIDFAGGPDQYPGDNAPRDEIAAWMAEQAKKRGLPPELPVMASLVESGMRNIHYGDADSVGFYQMRVGIWNKGAYAGYPDKPELQVKWFLDQAAAVKRQRLGEGKSVTDPHQYGDWIADVERPAEQYRGRYQLRLGEAQALLKSHSHPARAPAPAPAGAPPAVAAAAPNGGSADVHLKGAVADAVAAAVKAGDGPGPRALLAIQEAEKYIGTPYHFGGSTPQTGFDCSGLMQWAYAHAGIKLPRVSEQQILAPNGVHVDRDHLRPGDLVFFDEGGDIGHVGMYIGNDEILHAPHTGDVVKVASLDDSWFVQHFAGGRRFDAGAPAGGLGAPAAAAAAAAPPVDPAEVASAHAAVARDAAEVQRKGTLLFHAVRAQEARKERMTVQFMKAIDPSQVKRPAAAAATPAPPATPAAAVPPDAAAAPQPSAAPAGAGSVVDVAGAAAGYPGDHASQAQLARWLSVQAQKAGLPPELPVMASLVESGVRNLDFGDADSVGFFQMRVSVWDKGPYAGYQHKPELQIKWFIDQALAVKRKAIADGDAGFGKDPSKYGEWIADVERPLEAYRGRYQLRLEQARKLLGL